MSRRLRLLAVLGLAGAAGALAQGNNEGVFEPGVRHVCVPNADGEGWDCGTESNPPANYRPPQAEVDAGEPAAQAVASPEVARDELDSSADSTPLPPPFLMDPDRQTPYAPVEEPAAEPATAAEAVIATESATPTAVVEGEPVAAGVYVPQDGIDGTVSESAGRAELVSAPGATTAPDPAPAATPPATAAPSPAPPAVATNTSVAALGDADAFARLPATSFTLQLAYADSAAGFPRLVAQLGLDPATCYVLRVRGAQGATWLLAHGAYVDVAAARAAQAALPRVSGLSAQWPRRIGALQTEITQGR